MPSTHIADPEPGASLAHRPFVRQSLLILWPAFVMAGVLEMLVFAVVDPLQLQWFGGGLLQWSRSAIYSVTFLIFWGMIATSGAITQLLLQPDPLRGSSQRL